jgi:hypothetical protein
VFKRYLIHVAAAALAILGFPVASQNPATAATPQHHDQAPSFYRRVPRTKKWRSLML